eukprot:560588-Prorocentrum_minimum.AAC.1
MARRQRRAAQRKGANARRRRVAAGDRQGRRGNDGTVTPSLVERATLYREWAEDGYRAILLLVPARRPHSSGHTT